MIRAVHRPSHLRIRGCVQHLDSSLLPLGRFFPQLGHIPTFLLGAKDERANRLRRLRADIQPVVDASAFEGQLKLRRSGSGIVTAQNLDKSTVPWRTGIRGHHTVGGSVSRSMSLQSKSYGHYWSSTVKRKGPRKWAGSALVKQLSPNPSRDRGPGQILIAAAQPVGEDAGMLRVGIVGLPNVGKSTLFNALTRSHTAGVANYPFSTIEPTVGVAEAPDERLERLAEIVGVDTVILSTIELVDIAGLVAGASEGAGLGNQFLAHIREVDAIIQVVRCFADDDVAHYSGKIDPVGDIETVSIELILADLRSAENQMVRNLKRARGGDREAVGKVALLERLLPHLEKANPANTLDLHEEERPLLQSLFLLTAKPAVFACNVSEAELSQAGASQCLKEVREHVRSHHQSVCAVVCADLEEELGDLTVKEAAEYLRETGLPGSGRRELIGATYEILNLASFFTFNESEARAWPFRKSMKAPQCAGLVHTDFERAFIRAETVSFTDLDRAGSISSAREKGLLRLEGKDYAVRDGDVILFRTSP